MIAYPAYTVEGIRRELSWRQVNLLLGYWEDDEPVNITVNRIKEVLCKHTGLKFEKVEKISVDNLINKLEDMGLSIG
jgi:hypothetical protein